MLAEVIAIGDELTSGQRLDTNSQWLSERLGELGIRVMYHTTVADDLAANERIFREAFSRADLIIATGGLGPTADDLTRDAIATATDRELELHEPSLEHIRNLFERRGREMPDRNIVQARFPRGSRVVHNPNGSAPGIDLAVPRQGQPASRIFALPGVPAEMREMWNETVGPAIRESLGDSLRVICHRRVKCFGAGESAIEEMLPDLVRRGRVPTVGITASNATITLRVSAQAESVDASHRLMRPTIETIYECLGSLIYGEEDDELQDVVVRRLKETGKSLATIEWGTGGLVSNWLNEADPGGRAYLGGIVVRNRDALQRRGPADSAVHPPVDQSETVTSMAQSCHHDFQADYTLAIGPFPAIDNVTNPTETLHLALSTNEGVLTKSVDFGGHPAIVRPRSAKQALNFLRLELAAE
jgi:nicotinamide-nucleotide amidase